MKLDGGRCGFAEVVKPLELVVQSTAYASLVQISPTMICYRYHTWLVHVLVTRANSLQILLEMLQDQLPYLIVGDEIFQSFSFR